MMGFGGARMKKLIAVLMLVATPLVAGMSKKYKNWDKSPEAYYLTHDEKAEWKKVKTDEAAESFVAAYKAKRPAAFWEEFGKRVAVADKYFTVGSTKGSETLRGKIVILFGPPSSIVNGAGTGTSTDKEKNASDAVSQSSMGGGKNEGVSAGSSGGGNPLYSSHSSGVTAQSYPTMTFSYDDTAAPKSVGKGFQVTVRVISNSNQEPVNEKDFDEKAEAVARASQEPAPAK